jgi:hypothetical protein
MEYICSRPGKIVGSLVLFPIVTLTKCCKETELADSCELHSTDYDYDNMYADCNATCCPQCGQVIQECTNENTQTLN